HRADLLDGDVALDPAEPGVGVERLDRGEVPSHGANVLHDLARRFVHGDQQDLLAAPYALEQERDPEQRLAAPGTSRYEVRSTGHEAPAEHTVQSGNPGRDARGERFGSAQLALRRDRGVRVVARGRILIGSPEHAWGYGFHLCRNDGRSLPLARGPSAGLRGDRRLDVRGWGSSRRRFRRRALDVRGAGHRRGRRLVRDRNSGGRWDLLARRRPHRLPALLRRNWGGLGRGGRG